ncbi:expressed unknown protein [Seminavis robusta]|uniref:Uncharacterized protein n=1 Tax=Seminavis robusta TaxID=568900 RepID=A0A9N8HDB9_9STRA|nr:expressed unknown protein [Seminavis robusta]|eukprot:Sro420_g139290.1 n/a (668) ;mRNA; r:29428-31431
MSSSSNHESSTGAEGLSRTLLDEIGDSDSAGSSSSSDGSSSYQQVSLTVLNALAEKGVSLVNVVHREFQRQVLPLLQSAMRDWQSGIQAEWERYLARGNSTTRFILTVLCVFVVAFHVELLQLARYCLQKGGLLERWKLALTLYWQQVKRQRRRSRRIRQSKKLSVLSNASGTTSGTSTLLAQQPERLMTSSALPNKLSSPTSTASTVEDSGLHSSRPLTPPPSDTTNSKNTRSYQNSRGRQQQQLLNDSSNSSSVPYLQVMHKANSHNNSRSRSPMRSVSMGHGPAARAANQSATAYRSRSPMRSVSMGHGVGAKTPGSVSPTPRRQSHSSHPYTPSNYRSRGPGSIDRARGPGSVGHGSIRSIRSGSSRSSNNNSRFLQDSNASFDVLGTGQHSSGSIRGAGGSSSLLQSISQQPQNTSTSTIASKDTKDTTTQSHSNSVTSSFSYATPKEQGAIVMNNSSEYTATTNNNTTSDFATSSSHRISRRLKRRSVHTTTTPSKQMPPESAPSVPMPAGLRRSQTVDGVNSGGKQRFKKNPAVPQPQRRRMSASESAGGSVPSTPKSQFSAADSRLLSRLGAVGTTPQRQKSSGTMSSSRRKAGSNGGSGGTSSSTPKPTKQKSQRPSRSLPNTPKTTRGNSPVPTRTPNTSHRRPIQEPLSRQELGYE